MSDYEQFKKLVLEGKAEPEGRASALVGEPSDDELYEAYRAELSGEAARRRGIEDAREDQRETEREWRLWAAHVGSPLPRNFEQ